MSTLKVVGGAKLDEALAQILAKHKKGLAVGILEGSTYPGGESTATVAFLDEYGSESSPPRPFMRITADTKSDMWTKALAVRLKAGDDMDSALRNVGELAVATMKGVIASGVGPANAESTIKRKGHGQTLRDTKHMMNSIAYEVVDTDEKGAKA
ncbi:hypothetical protein [Pandoraea terrigena]|uniref:Phage protein n=1 Tax=Pandoraea terrigena TaxID=2508292 RepID=A0A5E4V8R9_9BURK|nr:hypothetical protein [Pandoraea terrigena]VVE07455.1 hypothetical protein PTE31013_02464 [Pandoraea terrigena]